MQSVLQFIEAIFYGFAFLMCAIPINYNDHAKSVKTDLNNINLGHASSET